MVLRVNLGISADYVIGVLVAVLMGVLVFGIMVVFFVQRKKEENVSSLPEACATRTGIFSSSFAAASAAGSSKKEWCTPGKMI